MKNLATAIKSKASGSAFNTAIGGRLYRGAAPDGATYPYVVYLLPISDDPQSESTFTEDCELVQMQFSIFSNTQGSTNEVETIFGYLKALYDWCNLTITGSELFYMQRTNAILMSEDHTTINGNQRVWHYAVDYEILTQLN